MNMMDIITSISFQIKFFLFLYIYSGFRERFESKCRAIMRIEISYRDILVVAGSFDSGRYGLYIFFIFDNDPAGMSVNRMGRHKIIFFDLERKDAVYFAKQFSLSSFLHMILGYVVDHG